MQIKMGPSPLRLGLGQSCNSHFLTKAVLPDSTSEEETSMHAFLDDIDLNLINLKEYLNN